MIGYYKSHEQVSTIRVLFQQWLVYFKISLWHQFQHSVWNKFGWKYLFIISSINKLSVGTATKLVILPPPHSINRAIRWYTVAWSSLVEGDEQLDRPNSQTFMELCLACAALFLGVWHKVNSFLLGPIQSSSPSTKELLALGNVVENLIKYLTASKGWQLGAGNSTVKGSLDMIWLPPPDWNTCLQKEHKKISQE